MNTSPLVNLNNGLIVPQLGFGTSQLKQPGEATNAVAHALQVGYRLIDTAAAYGNEAEVGAGITKSGINRTDITVVTKLWPDYFDDVAGAFEHSRTALGLDFIDIYLIHFPKPGYNLKVWHELEALYVADHIKAIGVSNFSIEQLEELRLNSKTIPVLNQIELHPLLQQHELRNYHAEHNIQTQAWMPMGRGQLLTHPLFVELGAQHNKTPAQIILRWHMQSEVMTIPKSSSKHRIAENFAIFDFELSADDMQSINELDQGQRLGASPDQFA